VHLVITARAENHIRGGTDLDDTIARLQGYQQAGADVVFAPGIVSADGIRRLVAEVDCPVSVLVLPGAPTIAELAELGVGRISVGGGFYRVAMGAVVAAGRELLDEGTYGFWDQAGVGREVVAEAFGPRRTV
jgi:2-methylisocitrate lyase-like PEP mutase family enzyme